MLVITIRKSSKSDWYYLSIDIPKHKSLTLLPVAFLLLIHQDMGNFLDYHINPTYAIYTVVSSHNWSSAILPNAFNMDLNHCIVPRYGEEGSRAREQGWFSLEALDSGHVSLSLGHLPTDLVYGEHYRIALYVNPSRCVGLHCSSQSVRQASEELPCRLPLELPPQFMDSSVPKNQVLNLTLFALEDSLFKAEIHILTGLHQSMDALFVNSAVITMSKPQRALTLMGLEPNGRKLSPFVSFEEAIIPENKLFAAVYRREFLNSIETPLNLPPR